MNKTVVSLVLTSLPMMNWAMPTTQGAAPTPDVTDRSVYQVEAVKAIPLSSPVGMSALVKALQAERVVMIGETHDRYEHHLNQLEIIKGLGAAAGPLAIGMEFFQQPYQQILDDYLAGKIEEREFLRGTEYFTRWRFDYRLYRPILRWARAEHVPVLALQVPSEVARQVGQGGYDSLPDNDRRWIPQILPNTASTSYRERLHAVFQQHPGAQDKSFEHFLEVQWLWDETMARRATTFLTEHPGHRLVILAGGGHVNREAIADRIQRDSGLRPALVQNGPREPLDLMGADYLLHTPEASLPPLGLFGLMLDDSAHGLGVSGFGAGSAAETAGVKVGDHLLALDGQSLQDYPDLRIQMLDKAPGDKVRLKVKRHNLLLGDDELEFEIQLK